MTGPQPRRPAFRICIVCGQKFYRRGDESYEAFVERLTCTRYCTNKISGEEKSKNQSFSNPHHEITYSYVLSDDFSCVHCTSRFEDSDIGEHCGPCRNGSNFRRKQ